MPTVEEFEQTRGTPLTDTAWKNAPLADHGGMTYMANFARQLERTLHAEERKLAVPIDMLLFCPQCDYQHVDEPQPHKGWTNPPHRSHQCQKCGHIWRPCDRATNGVAKIATKGQHDLPAYPTTLHELSGVPGGSFKDRVRYLLDNWLNGSSDPEAIYSRKVADYLYRYAHCIEMESHRIMAFENSLECESASDCARLRVMEDVIKDVRQMAARLHNMKEMI